MDEILALLSLSDTGWGDEIASGVGVTISLALATLPLGLLIGFFVALAKQSEEPTLRLAGNIYTTVFRGLPELLTLFLVYFGAQIGIRQLLLAMGSGWHYYLTAIRPVLRDEKREPVSTLTYTAHIFVFASGLVLAPLYEKSKVGGLLPTTSKLH